MATLYLNVVASVRSNVNHNTICLPPLVLMVLNCAIQSNLNIGEEVCMLIVGYFHCLFCAEGLLLHILGVALPFGQECSTIGWEHILDGRPNNFSAGTSHPL